MYVTLSAACMPVLSPVTVYSNRNKNVVELSGTGVPPSLLDEVQERRSGAFRLKLSTGMSTSS